MIPSKGFVLLCDSPKLICEHEKKALFCALMCWSPELIDPEEIDPAMREGIVRLAREMNDSGVDPDEPERLVMALLGDRWSSLILLVLETGTWRHAELRRTLCKLSFEGAISQRVLTLKLRALEREGFVDRAVTADIPPKVSYRLTGLGQKLVDRLRQIIAWISGNRLEILAARERFDNES